MGWNDLISVNIDDIKGLNPCRLCHNHCYEAEGVQDGFDDKGFLMRIESTCNESDDYEEDDCRTEFSIKEEAISEWNKMNPVGDFNYVKLIKVIKVINNEN